MNELEYDVVALGGGTAGLVTAAGARLLGARAAVVEREALGGDCLWTGCVPSKALVATARRAHDMSSAVELGLSASSGRHDFSRVMARMRDARSTVAHHDDPERFRSMGVDVHHGSARFLAPGLVEVDGIGRIRSKRFVIATGAGPVIPPIAGLETAGYLSNVTAFDQTELPRRIVIIGGGPIGLEFAQIYRRLGAEVTVVELTSRILPREDPDVADLVERLLTEEGVAVQTDVSIERVEADQTGKTCIAGDGRRFPCDEIFVAVGRRPNTVDLDLDRAGVELHNGAVRVDRTLRTTARGVWAAGDVLGGLQFTHVAEYQAKVVVQNALLPLKKKVDYSAVPWVTYLDPEVAHVGMLESRAKDEGARTFSYPFSELDRAIADGDTKGMVKISADKKGRILGATIVGAAAGELIFPLVLAITHGIPLSKISSTIYPYPTRMEGVKRAADEYQKTRLDGLAGSLLRKVVSWLR
jgi:pyruvate/2-oxoglutarate dehydrogenase complex dihydrolipoamide dehydrogenase (E3) component